MYNTGEGRQKGEGWAKKAIWGNIPASQRARFGSVENVTSEQFADLWRERYARGLGYKNYAAMENDRKQLDKTAAAGTKVEGSGKITVDVNAPKGTKVGAEGKGLFKDTEVNRQTQMEPARKGPEVLSI